MSATKLYIYLLVHNVCVYIMGQPTTDLAHCQIQLYGADAECSLQTN